MEKQRPLPLETPPTTLPFLCRHTQGWQGMNIDVYRSTKRRSKFLSLPAGTDLKSFQFPVDLDKDLLTVSKFKSIDIDPNRPMTGMDTRDVAEQIGARGFAVHGATVRFETPIPGSK